MRLKRIPRSLLVTRSFAPYSLIGPAVPVPRRRLVRQHPAGQNLPHPAESRIKKKPKAVLRKTAVSYRKDKTYQSHERARAASAAFYWEVIEPQGPSRR
jgi:hypothetical protein